MHCIMPATVERSHPSSATPTVSAGTHPHHDHGRSAHHKEALRLALGSILAPKRPYTPISRSSSGSATPIHTTSESLPSRPGDSSHLHPHPHHSHHPSSSSGLSRSELTSTPPGTNPSFPQHHFPYFTVHPHTTMSSPAYSNPNSGLATPEVISVPGSAAGSPPVVHSPGPSGHSPVPMSAPEEGPLQLLPPIVAAGSTTGSPAENSSTVSAPPVQAVHLGTNSNGTHTAVDHGGRGRSVHYRSRGNGGTSTPRAGFIETLQNKNNAWDALIHGSFS
ncbi:hypothetical protein AX15_001235 [Amanita polypyramis BW_CC]|nr:hypothetical protein AX15_001235 [Amanita polypyramis BW_CC]